MPPSLNLLPMESTRMMEQDVASEEEIDEAAGPTVLVTWLRDNQPSSAPCNHESHEMLSKIQNRERFYEEWMAVSNQKMCTKGHMLT